MLSAVIRSEHSYPAMPLAGQQVHQRSVRSGPLVLRTNPFKNQRLQQIGDQPVLHNSSHKKLLGFSFQLLGCRRYWRDRTVTLSVRLWRMRIVDIQSLRPLWILLGRGEYISNPPFVAPERRRVLWSTFQCNPATSFHVTLKDSARYEVVPEPIAWR